MWLVSLCLAVPLIFGAPMVGWFYGDERVAALTRGFAAVIVIGGLGAQHSGSAQPQHAISFPGGSRYAFRASWVSRRGAFWPLIFHSYWALFAGAAISATVSVVGAWIGSGFVPGLPRWEPSARQMVRLGAGITGFNVFTFVARNLDNVLIGRVWGDAALGLYDRAYKFLLFPLVQINAPLGRVMLPTLARLRTDGPRYCSAYLRAVNQLLLVTQPGIVFAIATADIFVPILLGERLARGGADLPVARSRGIATADQRHDELAVHQSRAKQSFCLVWGVQCRYQRGRVLRRVALGTDWRCGRLFHFTGSIAVAGHVVDGDTNGAGATSRSLQHRDNARSGKRRLLRWDRCGAPRNHA